MVRQAVLKAIDQNSFQVLTGYARKKSTHSTIFRQSQLLREERSTRHFGLHWGVFRKTKSKIMHVF